MPGRSPSYKELFAAGVVPHGAQRYETTGDWEFMPPSRHGDDQPLEVRVSSMGNRSYEFLVAIHETIEAWLCRERGISGDAVTAYDKAYEHARGHKAAAPCGCVPTGDSEPGDDAHAPYFREHQVASYIERRLAAELGVDWDAYEQANLTLFPPLLAEEPTCGN